MSEVLKHKSFPIPTRDNLSTRPSWNSSLNLYKYAFKVINTLINNKEYDIKLYKLVDLKEFDERMHKLHLILRKRYDELPDDHKEQFKHDWCEKLLGLFFTELTVKDGHFEWLVFRPGRVDELFETTDMGDLYFGERAYNQNKTLFDFLEYGETDNTMVFLKGGSEKQFEI
jgi:hypothetical protein